MDQNRGISRITIEGDPPPPTPVSPRVGKETPEIFRIRGMVWGKETTLMTRCKASARVLKLRRVWELDTAIYSFSVRKINRLTVIDTGIGVFKKNSDTCEVMIFSTAQMRREPAGYVDAFNDLQYDAYGYRYD